MVKERGVVLVVIAVALLVFASFACGRSTPAPEPTSTPKASAELTEIPTSGPEPTADFTSVPAMEAPVLGDVPEVGVDRGIWWDVREIVVSPADGVILGIRFLAVAEYWNTDILFVATPHPEGNGCAPKMTSIIPLEQGREITLRVDLGYCGMESSTAWVFTHSMVPEAIAVSREVVAECFVGIWGGQTYFSGDCSGDMVVVAVQP